MKKEKTSFILNIMIDIFIVFFLIILIFVINSKFIKNEKIVSLFGKSILVVTTESMKPTINAGDLIIISSSNEYNKNDIVTFVDEDICVTHRIIKNENGMFITMGDANNIADNPIKKDQILGKVIFKSHILGIIVLYYFKPIVVIYFLFSIMLLVVQSIRENEKNTNETIKEETNEKSESL